MSRFLRFCRSHWALRSKDINCLARGSSPQQLPKEEITAGHNPQQELRRCPWTETRWDRCHQRVSHVLPLPIATASCNTAAQATDPNKQPHKNCQLDINHSTRGTPCQPQSLPATGAAPAACATAPGTGDLRYQQGGRREGRQNPPKMGQKPSSENRNHFSRSAEMPALTHYSPQQQKTLLRYFFFINCHKMM